MTEIVFASHNIGKVREVSHLLHSDEIRLLTLGDVHLHDFMIEETGLTYEENSMLKAKTVGDKTRRATLADDSGLEVEALDGKPGLHSARFAKGSDKDRCIALLKVLEGKQNRKAKFVAVIVFYDPVNKQKHVFRGEVKGMIGHEMKGEEGFGYDPLFTPDGFEQTMAQLGNEIKNKISHRAIAVAAFKNWWDKNK